MDPESEDPDASPPAPIAPAVPPLLDRLAGWSWRLLVIGVAIVALGFVVSRLRLVLLPVALAFLLSTMLTPPARWLVRRGFRPVLATWSTIVGFLGAVVAIGIAIVPPVVDEFGDLGPTLEDAAAEIEDWLVVGPFNLDRSTVIDARERIETAVEDAFTSDGAVVETAMIAGEIIAGVVLTLVITFFFVKDGEQLQRWALERIPDRHRARARRTAAAAWSTLSHFIAGAAILGAVEAVIIGVTLALTGSAVVLPVVALTFIAAFVPFVGAVVAGIVAVLVSLVSSGFQASVVVAIVVILVQQFDNELLAPVIYGRALRLHPLVVILAVFTGAAIGGFLGAFVAVPVTAVVVNSLSAATVERE